MARWLRNACVNEQAVPAPWSVPLFQPAGTHNRAVTESSLGPKGESGHFQGGISSSLSHTGQRRHLLFLTTVREKPRFPAEGQTPMFQTAEGRRDDSCSHGSEPQLLL